jgi:RNA polymerase subunit RPABC4/transcription elongation factor Spt4
MTDEVCPYCFGIGMVPNWIYRSTQNCFVKPRDRAMRDCPECGATGIVLDYDPNNVIPETRALEVAHADL